jgi:predicted glycoside hydrolase/deacetylase ChbG (UPF0249 family)
MSGERRLIVNADDFGRSPGINAGIVHCHQHGIVSSTTLMVNLAWAEEAIALREACPALGVGLHLNFCYGEPVADSAHVSSLVDERGAFVTDTAWVASNARLADIVFECEAQLARFQELAGHPPTHVDSHKYLHSEPRIRAAVIEVARRRGLPVRAVTDEDRVAIRSAGLRTTEQFEGRFHGLDGIGVSRDILGSAIRDLPLGTTELMCHPGLVDQHIADSSYSADREREIEALCDPQVRQTLECLAVRLVTFADLDGAA